MIAQLPAQLSVSALGSRFGLRHSSGRTILRSKANPATPVARHCEKKKGVVPKKCDGAPGALGRQSLPGPARPASFGTSAMAA